MSISINVTSAPAGPDDPLVFEVLASGSIDGVTANVTDPGGAVVSVYDNGDVAGYTSTSEAITGGLRITVRRLFGWWLGALSVQVNAGASGPSETLLYDSGNMPTVRNINDPNADYVFAIPGINTFGTGSLKLVVTADIEHNSGGFQTTVGLADPGAVSIDAATGALAFLKPATTPGSSYATFTYVDNATLDPYSLFTGSGTAKSLYFHTPFAFPAGAGDFNIKNINVQVYSEGGGTESATTTSSFTVAAPGGALVTQARSRVILQYQNSPKLLKEIELHAMIGQQVMDFFASLPPLDDPANATGVNLDVDAEIVGQGRQLSNGDTATDGELRVLIGAKITRNTARVSNADYLASMVRFFGAKVRLDDHGAMALSYVVMREPTADEVAVLDEDIVARPMGVKVSRSWAPSIYFGYAGDPSASGYGVGHYVEGF
jgi:hypothetical protein